MTLTKFFNKKYRERKDKDNMYGVGMSDAEFRHFIIEYLLPEGWRVSDPLGQSQINEIAIYEILEKHSKKFRKERRRSKHDKKIMDLLQGELNHCPNCGQALGWNDLKEETK